MNKKGKIALIPVLLASSAFAVVGVQTLEHSKTKHVIATTTPHSITLNRDAYQYEGTGATDEFIVKTALNNPITFEVNGFQESSTGIAQTKLHTGNYIRNTTPLNRLAEIEIHFSVNTDDNPTFRIKYGFEDIDKMVEVEYTYYGESPYITYDFNNEYPSYFYIDADMTSHSYDEFLVTYDSIKITYECADEPEEMPEAYTNTNLKFIKSIIDYGDDDIMEYYEVGGFSRLKELTAEDKHSVQIPETFMELPVFGIRRESFYQQSDITSLNLSSASYLSNIGDYAFYDCHNISSAIDFPSNVRSIGDYSFYGLWTNSITLNEGLSVVGSFAFASTWISSMNIPSTLNYIYGGAFNNCLNLVSFTVASGNTYFSTLDEGSVLVHSGHTIVAAAGNQGNIPEGLDIGNYAYCANFTHKYLNVYTYITPESNIGYVSIREHAFEDALKMQVAYLPGVASIGEYTFKGCVNLKYIYLNGSCQISGLIFSGEDAYWNHADRIDIYTAATEEEIASNQSIVTNLLSLPYCHFHYEQAGLPDEAYAS